MLWEHNSPQRKAYIYRPKHITRHPPYSHTYQSFTQRLTTTTGKRHPLLLSHTQRLTDPWCATKFIFPPQIDTLIYSISLCGCLNLDLGCEGAGGSKWSHFIALSCFNNGPVISERRTYCVRYGAQPALWRWRKHRDGLHGCRRVRPRRGATCLWKGTSWIFKPVNMDAGWRLRRRQPGGVKCCYDTDVNANSRRQMNGLTRNHCPIQRWKWN